MRKYQFKDRADAEEAYREADRARLRAEWLLTAWIQGKCKAIASVEDKAIGYVTLNHSALVYVLRTHDSIHCVTGLWDCDSEQIGNVIAGLLRYEDSHELGLAIDRARAAAWHSLLATA